MSNLFRIVGVYAGSPKFSARELTHRLSVRENQTRQRRLQKSSLLAGPFYCDTFGCEHQGERRDLGRHARPPNCKGCKQPMKSD